MPGAPGPGRRGSRGRGGREGHGGGGPARPGRPPALKRFGQHFLSDRSILTAIVDALAPTISDTVVEVGPGRGSLTGILAERSGRLIAVEIDRALAAQLRERYADNPKVLIIEGDFLATDAAALAGTDFLLIGNVPYYITTPIVFRALEPPMPRRSVFLVQREVAERMAAAAGTAGYGALSVNVAVVANVEQVMTVPARAFRPPPRVESAVVRLTPRHEPLVGRESLAGFRAFVQAVFAQRRKQMVRVLRTVRGTSLELAVDSLARAGIDRAARPETVTAAEFAQLFGLMAAAAAPAGGDERAALGD